MIFSKRESNPAVLAKLVERIKVTNSEITQGSSNLNDDYLQKLRDAHPMERFRKALEKIATKKYGCCGADRIAQEALGLLKAESK